MDPFKRALFGGKSKEKLWNMVLELDIIIRLIRYPD